jgi:hypothetical protein
MYIFKLTSGLLLAILFFQTVQADSFNDDWKAFQQAESQAFNDFRSEHDKAFTQFLEQHWEEFDLYQGKTRDVTPKPPKAPIVKNWITSRYDKVEEPLLTNKVITNNNQRSDLFFGHATNKINFPDIDFPDLSKPNNKTLSKVWKQLSNISHDAIIQELTQQKRNLDLGDWGFYLYLDYLLKQQFSVESQHISYLWFLLNKMNYDVRIAYDQSQIYLMVASNQTLYGKSFVDIKNVTYYMLKGKVDQSPLLSYPGQYSPDNHNLNVNFKNIIKPSGQTKSRTLSYKDKHGTANVQLDFDSGVSSMLNFFPQIDLIHYFSAQPNKVTTQSLRYQINNKLEGLSTRESVNFLLNLTQTGFIYAKDQQQFGEENYLLTEESLLYQANDCEDRSIFLAWLLKDLLKLSVIGLDFPGHIAIAVELQDEANDWKITSNGRTYVMADPTYIGAKAGMVMPSVKNEQPKIINF